MWWDLPFQSFRPNKKATTKIENCKKFFVWNNNNNIWENPQKLLSSASYCVVSLLWVIVCQREEKEANLLIWTSLHFCAHLWQTAPYSQHKSHSFDVYGLFLCLQSLSFLNIRYRLICSRSVFDREVYFQIMTQRMKTNCQILLDFENGLGWKQDFWKNRATQHILWKDCKNCECCSVSFFTFFGRRS